MSNGHEGGGPPNPPEVLKVICIFKGDDVAIFKGGDVDSTEMARLVLNGSTGYFTQGAGYTVTFDPVAQPPSDIPPDK